MFARALLGVASWRCETESASAMPGIRVRIEVVGPGHQTRETQSGPSPITVSFFFSSRVHETPSAAVVSEMTSSCADSGAGLAAAMTTVVKTFFGACRWRPPRARRGLRVALEVSVRHL